MEENSGSADCDNEIHALRARVEQLERELANLRKEGRTPESFGSGQSAAERAIAGFFEQPLVMLFIADLVEGRFLKINRKVCEVLGHTEEEILQSSFIDRVHPDDRRKTMLEMERLAAGERTVGFRNRHRDADGNYRVFDWTASVDTDRELCYAMAIEVIS